MKTVLITGGSGLIGTALTKALLAGNHRVRHLSRKPGNSGAVAVFRWSVKEGYIDPKALEDVDVVVHLAGAAISPKRWTKDRIKLLKSSRCDTIDLLLQAFKRSGTAPSTFISASGAHYHGAITSEQIFQETDPPGRDTIADICIDWEKSADKFKRISRVVKLRTPIVLSEKGGALEKLALPVKLFVGSAFGNGRQWMPWIHMDDLVKAYISAIRNEEMSGAYNVCSPEHVTQKDFIRVLGSAMSRPIWAPNVPASLLNLILGEQSTILLKGSRIDSSKLENAGFSWKFPDLESALIDLVG